jgi:hypothetical protein
MDLKVFSPSEYKRGNYGKNELPIFLWHDTDLIENENIRGETETYRLQSYLTIHLKKLRGNHRRMDRRGRIHGQMDRHGRIQRQMDRHGRIHRQTVRHKRIHRQMDRHGRIHKQTVRHRRIHRQMYRHRYTTDSKVIS